jgi:hypothetical protein
MVTGFIETRFEVSEFADFKNSPLFRAGHQLDKAYAH